MYGYIYKTTNLINGKIYIGKKTSEVFLPWYKGSGRVLGEAFAKYGWDNFSVEFLCPCFSLKELNAEERFLIKYFDCRVKHGKGYNISEGGDWGDISEGMSQEDYERWCRNLREACSGERNGFYGKKHTEESKKLISEHHADFSGENHPMYGKHLSQATRKKISEARKRLSPEARRNISNAQKGKTLSESTKLKISQSIKGEHNPFYGRHHSEESKARMREANLGRSTKGYKYHLVCKVCGKEFIGTSSRQKYCSPECKLNKASYQSK